MAAPNQCLYDGNGCLSSNVWHLDNHFVHDAGAPHQSPSCQWCPQPTRINCQKYPNPADFLRYWSSALTITEFLDCTARWMIFASWYSKQSKCPCKFIKLGRWLQWSPILSLPLAMLFWLHVKRGYYCFAAAWPCVETLHHASSQWRISGNDHVGQICSHYITCGLPHDDLSCLPMLYIVSNPLRWHSHPQTCVRTIDTTISYLKLIARHGKKITATLKAVPEIAGKNVWSRRQSRKAEAKSFTYFHSDIIDCRCLLECYFYHICLPNNMRNRMPVSIITLVFEYLQLHTSSNRLPSLSRTQRIGHEYLSHIKFRPHNPINLSDNCGLPSPTKLISINF